MAGRPEDAAPVEDALAKLREAMRTASGGTTDPDRRRAAAMIGELTRSDDADLGRFAQRHLPGREVDEGAVRDLRELLLGVARLLAVQGRAASASEVAGAVRNQLFARLDELEAAAKEGVGAGASAASRDELGPAGVPAAMPAQAAASGPARVIPSYLQAAASPWSPTARGAVAAPVPAAAPAPPAAALHAAPPAFVAPAFVAPAPAAPLPFTPAPLPFTPVPAAPSFVAPPAQHPPMTIPPATVESGAQFEDEGTVVGASLDLASIQVATGLPFLRTATPPRAMAMAMHDVDQAPSSQVPSSRGLAFREGAGAHEPLPPLPPHLAFIDLRSHATLTAMVQVFPERLVEICHQYGLVDPSERKSLDDHWYARFRSLPHEREEWARYRDHAIAHYRSGR
jgi:hypothetical protein